MNASAHAAIYRQRRDEAYAVKPVVHAHADRSLFCRFGAVEAEHLVLEARREREDKETMYDGRSEWRLAPTTVRIRMYLLVVTGDARKGVDRRLVECDPIRDA